jgi:hypothetical protein
MSEPGYGTITIPLKALKIPEVIKRLNAEFGGNYRRNIEYEDELTITFSQEMVRDGRFELLEGFFEKRKIPFDRHSDSCCGAYDPETCYYRPKTEKSEEISETILETENSEEYVSVEDLKEALALPTYALIVAKIEEFIKKNSSCWIPKLGEFVKEWNYEDSVRT